MFFPLGGGGIEGTRGGQKTGFFCYISPPPSFLHRLETG